jgi:hypothetical protein
MKWCWILSKAFSTSIEMIKFFCLCFCYCGLLRLLIFIC